MARIKLQLTGFDKMLESIQAAGGDIDKAAATCIRQSAQIMHADLQDEMQKSGVDNGLISRMPPPEIGVTGNTHTAKVGYKMGGYDPANPSDGYKVAFLNYGTPKRQTSDDGAHAMVGGGWVTLGKNRGEIAARGFIVRAKENAAPKIKKEQRDTLKKILAEVSK